MLSGQPKHFYHSVVAIQPELYKVFASWSDNLFIKIAEKYFYIIGIVSFYHINLTDNNIRVS